MDQTKHPLGSVDTLLNDGEMRAYELDGQKLVLARVGGDYFAFRQACTHYGGPLNEGVLRGHTVMCPWHHACFDIRSGSRVEPPALNDLPTYTVTVEGGTVYVETEPRKPDPFAARATEPRTVVIVGGGAAGNAAAEELRRQGYAGNIILLSAVGQPPIDRPNVSKDYLAGDAQPEWMPLRGEDWYAAHDIDLRLNVRVTGVNTSARTVTLADGETVAYDALLVATGAEPRTLDVPGNDLGNVFTLREQADADHILHALGEHSRVVVIGSSFIGMEVASSLGGRGAQVTVVGIDNVPFARTLGPEIGQMIQREHEANGVRFRLNSGVERLVGEGGRVTGVTLKGGEVLPADVVVIGIGVRPRTAFLRGSGLALSDEDGAVLVDRSLRASAPGVYAAGDIARYPDDDGSVRIEHWRLAQQHGMIAARSLAGSGDSMDHHVPFFWSGQWKLKLRYVGHAEGWDEIITRGRMDDKDFISFYVKDGRMRAAAGIGRDPEMDAVEFILRDGLPLTPAQMRDSAFDLVAYARTGA